MVETAQGSDVTPGAADVAPDDAEDVPCPAWPPSPPLLLLLLSTGGDAVVPASGVTFRRVEVV